RRGVGGAALHRGRARARPRRRHCAAEPSRAARRAMRDGSGSPPEETAGEAAPEAAEVVEPEAPPAPLLELSDGLPPIIDTRDELERAAELIAAGTGPVAIDAERASGYRYSARAYLVQLRREGAGTALVDPIAFD